MVLRGVVTFSLSRESEKGDSMRKERRSEIRVAGVLRVSQEGGSWAFDTS